jgi:nitrogen regulatory protein P-II 1
MKRIEAIVRSSRVGDVREALGSIGIKGVTVCEVEGFDRREGGQAIWCPSAYSVGRPPESKIELVLPDAQAEGAVTTILRAAKLVELGENDVFSSTIGDAIRMQTVEEGEMALRE